MTEVTVDRLQMAVFEAIGQASRLRRPDGTYDDVLEAKIALKLSCIVRAEVYAALAGAFAEQNVDAEVTAGDLRAMFADMALTERRAALEVDM